MDLRKQFNAVKRDLSWSWDLSRNIAKTTTAIAKRGGTVKVETLNIAGMSRNGRLGGALSDAGMGEFMRIPVYKCAWYGTAFQCLDRWYPSSKTCNRCRVVKQSLLFSECTYHCMACGCAGDRDENAVRNIQMFPRAAGSVFADVETRKTDRTSGTHGQRSVNRTGSPYPIYVES